MNQSYSEARKQAPFNWFEFLNKKTYSSQELEAAVERAGSWVTCAVGNQCDIIPRSYSQPEDRILFSEGINFCRLLNNMYEYWDNKKDIERYRKEAIKSLQKIEERSFFLITELLHKEPNGERIASQR